MSGLFVLLCYLNVLTLSAQALEFSIEPKSVVVREGSIAILNCQAKQMSNNIFIHWKKGNHWIVDDKNKAYSLLKNGSLYFPSVGKKDEDKYICGASKLNTKTTIYSKPVYITLAYIRTNFIQPPSPTKVREHKTALLTCITGSSQPLPSVVWEKDGQSVIAGNSMAQHYITDQNATSASLELKNVSLADAGYYRCIAINPLLPNDHKKSPQALLLVLPKDDKPRIEVAPVTKIAPIDSPLQMDCIIVGVPPPVIYWLHDGLKVKSTSDIVVYSNGSLYIKSLASKHKGQYSCNGTNDKGSIASPNIFLYVAYIDYIFKQDPKDKAAVNGSNVELECDAPSHYPKNLIIYKWYNNYKVMTMNDRKKILPSGSLMFTPVLKSDEGVYVCEATNQYSRQTRTSKEAYLTVNVPPYFVITPSNQTVILYKTLHLSCVPQGSPTPHILWFHGNTLLSNSSTVYLGGDGSLNITSVETANAGLYECRIKNVAGIKTAVVFVDVHVPPNVTIIPKNTSVELGRNASFSCQFAGNPPPTLSWYFNQGNDKKLIPLSRNSSRFIQMKTQLRVVNIREKDKGWFTCVARNIVGLQNFSAYLNVLVPAYFTEFPRNTTVNETCTAVMVCRRYGNPPPTITWSKGGHLLLFNNKTTFNGTHLMIRNVTRNDSGTYSCTVENNLRKYTSSVYLTVQVAPIIQLFLGPSRTQWKNDISFHCKFDGVPKPDVQWFKDSHSIVYTRRIFAKGDTLNITSVGHNDTGNYTCKVSNNAGSAMMVKRLIVEVPPCRPLNLQLDNITSKSVDVLWKSGCDGFSPITSFRLETRTNSSWQKVSDFIKTEYFTIENLRPYTSYNIRVFSKNKIGWSKASESITLRTNEDSPSSPVDFKCRLHNSTAINLTWRKPFSPNGVLRQYRVQFKTFAGLDVEKSMTTARMSSIIHGLKSYTIYKFRIQAATGNQSLLWGNYTSYVKCRTGESAPSVAPLNFSVGAVRSDTILARWQVIPEAFRNGVVRKYCIQYKRTIEKVYSKRIECISENKTQYNIFGLRPWTEYTVRVSAETVRQGPWSEERMSRTNESEPTGAPTNIVVIATSSRSLSIKWDPPLENGRNGVLIGYTVDLYSTRDNTSVQITNATTNETSIEISGLLIYTGYNVQIRAFTKVGFGPFSHLKMARTGESYPGPVENLTKTIRNESVLIRWQPPGTPNGIITSYALHYNVTIKVIHIIPGTNATVTNITTQSQTITSNDTMVILNGIHGNVTYFLCVMASTSIGYGDCSKPIIFVTKFTPKFKPGKPAGFTPSIVDDHLPLIAAGATICFVIVIALFTCWIVKKRNRKNEEKKASLTYNFRGCAFRMDSFNDGESSRGSHGSRPINGYSMDSASLNSRTNTSKTFASRQPEGREITSHGSLRNNSLHLGSDASSYDDPYSSVAEIGVEASNNGDSNVDEAQTHSSENPLYSYVHGSFSDNGSLNSCVAVNPIYEPTFQQQPHINAGFSRDTNESDQLYRTNLPDKAAPVSSSSVLFKSPPSENSMEGIEYFSSDEDEISPHHSRYEVLVLPPPPPEYSDDPELIYDEVEQHQAFENAVTDF